MDSELMRSGLAAIALGIGATLVMDMWAIAQKRLFGVPSLDYRLVGRWIGHFPKGRLAHPAIGAAEPVPGEAALGWAAHYAVGIVFALVLVTVWPGWLGHPTLLPALVVGIASIVAPFFLMQPSFGLGIAASRTPMPWLIRFRSFLAHASFAVGLYLSGLLLSGLRELFA
ncbi:DUF2938 domain-containing protein [Labrys neptuniae]